MRFNLLLIGTIISHLVAGAAGWYLHAPKTVDRVVIREVEKPVVRYIKEVKKDDCAELFKAYMSPIMLDKTVTGGIINVKASDGYKETSAKWEILTTPDYRVYVGIGAAGLALGAYGMYKITR